MYPRQVLLDNRSRVIFRVALMNAEHRLEIDFSLSLSNEADKEILDDLSEVKPLRLRIVGSLPVDAAVDYALPLKVTKAGEETSFRHLRPQILCEIRREKIRKTVRRRHG